MAPSQGSEQVRELHQEGWLLSCQEGWLLSCHHYCGQCQERPGTQHSVTFFLLFFSLFPSFFFLSTSLCCANRIKTLTKISFSEEKHFYRTKTATCFAANTQLKAGKENIYKIQGFFSIFVFVFFNNAKRVIQNFQPYK